MTQSDADRNSDMGHLWVTTLAGAAVVAGGIFLCFRRRRRTDHVVEPGAGQLSLSSTPATVWRTSHFAKEWYQDAVLQAEIESSRGARRREIIFAVCCVESYLLEWVRDVVLQRDFGELVEYFPTDNRDGIRDRWKRVIKQLAEENRIAQGQDLGGNVWEEFRLLVEYRDGLVHGNSSRPESSSQLDDRQPTPSPDALDGLKPGWASNVVHGLVHDLHDTIDTPAPSWLVQPCCGS